MRRRERETESALAPARDDGFTLVEVIWALFLLGLIAMAALGFFTSGLKNIAHVQRQQAAVSLASSAMDLARSVPPGATDANSTSGLLRGRKESDVKAVWDAATAANSADTADMKMASDPSGSSVAAQWVPVTTTATVDTQKYTIDTLIGKCWRLKAASTTSQDCIGTDKSSDSTYLLMYRVRVVVRWDESSNGSAKYTYRLSSLVDPSADATWNTVLKPYAYDDEVLVSLGDNACIAIVTNDSVTYNLTTSPASVDTAPASGTVTSGGTGCPTGMYFKPGSKSGLTSFTYRVTGSAGDISPPATVTVHMLPAPVAKTIYVSGDGVSDITSKVTDGDLGITNVDSTHTTRVVPILDTGYNPFDTPTSPGVGDTLNLADIGISMSGSKVMFDPSKSPDGTSFYYYLVDSPTSGESASYHSETYAQVTVKVDPPSQTPDVATTYDAASPSKWNPITWQTDTNNDPTAQLKIISITGPSSNVNTNYSHVRLDNKTAAANAVGNTLSFSNDAAIGQYVITYKVVSLSGTVSSTQGTYTIQLLPSAGAYSVSTGSGSRTPTITIPSSSYLPTTGVALVNPVTNLVGCTVTKYDGFKLTLNYNDQSSTKTCTFTYSLVSTGLNPNVTGTTTGTVKVTRN